MQNFVRYSVVNENGRPVIRAVPVPRRLSAPVVRDSVVQGPDGEDTAREAPVRRRIRRLRLLDIR